MTELRGEVKRMQSKTRSHLPQTANFDLIPMHTMWVTGVWQWPDASERLKNPILLSQPSNRTLKVLVRESGVFKLECTCFTTLYSFLLSRKWTSCMCVHTSLRSPHSSEQRSSRPTVSSQESAVLYRAVYARRSQSPSWSHLPPLSLCYPYVCSPCLCLYFYFVNKFICAIFLDSTYMC